MSSACLILASASPRRAELLRAAGYDLEIVSSPAPEPDLSRSGLAPEQQARALATYKAEAVARLRSVATILAADTLVACDADVLGKPVDAADARRILRRLARTRHRVITGVCLLRPPDFRRVEHDVSWVEMREMSDAELDAYIASGAWRDKAGAYAIQEQADPFVRLVEGSFSNVVGLPMDLVARMLRELSHAQRPT